MLFRSRWDSEPSTNTATRAATEKSTLGSDSPETDNFGAPEQYRGRSVANETAPAVEHRQQRERILSGQPDADHGAD